jgi:replicative DNA helicase
MLAPPPHSIEAEQGLLGAILINNDALHAAGRLRPEEFFEPLHATIYDLCNTLITSGKLATPITVKSFLPEIEVAGLSVQQYLARLAAEATTIVNAPDYADTVREYAQRRAMIATAQAIVDAASDRQAGADIAAVITDAIGSLDGILGDGEGSRNAVPFANAAAEAIDLVAKAYQADGRVTGLSWCLSDLDRMTSGLHAGELTVLAGRPGMGKSAVAVSVGHGAAKSGAGTALFSLEMGRESLAMRALASECSESGHIPYFAMRRGTITEAQFERLRDAAVTLRDLPLLIDDQPSVTIAELGAKTRRAAKWMERKGTRLALVIVDYMQLLTPDNRYAGQRVQEVTQISAGLKRIARQHHVAVLALSQLSRGVESREDKRPQLSDLRDSGSIEQDADSVFMLYREGYYLQMRKPPESDGERFAEWMVAVEAAHGKLEIAIAKQRHGPTGVVEVYFDPATNAVRDLARASAADERTMI